jgi:hypothetical protein
MVVWPEKAHEWVALIGGILGTLLGLSSFLLAFLNFRRDRAQFRLVAGDDMGEYAHRRQYLSATNIGRRPIQIGAPWIFFRNIPRGNPLHPESEETYTLTENQRHIFEWESEVPLTEVEAFVIYDTTGRRHWLYQGKWFKKRFATRRLRRYIEGP